MKDSCNFVIMSYCGGDGDLTPVGATSWAKVNAGGNSMINQCILRSSPPSGGVVVVPSSENPLPMELPRTGWLIDPPLVNPPIKAVLTLWMWETGSLFDAILNEFTNNPAPMVPVSGNVLLCEWASGNATGVEPDMLRSMSLIPSTGSSSQR